MDIRNEILMHLRSLKKTRKDVSLHDPIGTDKEGNKITFGDILGSEADDVVGRFGLETGGMTGHVPRAFHFVY